jgi:hypothetical protein
MGSLAPVPGCFGLFSVRDMDPGVVDDVVTSRPTDSPSAVTLHPKSFLFYPNSWMIGTARIRYVFRLCLSSLPSDCRGEAYVNVQLEP